MNLHFDNSAKTVSKEEKNIVKEDIDDLIFKDQEWHISQR